MEKMNKVENSDIVRRTIFSLVNVASNKTSNDYAWSSIKKLLNELKSNYSFLEYVKIGELDELNNTKEDIIIMSKMNFIEPKDLGRAIQDLVDLYKKYLGKKAGYFFISEFKDVLGDEYHTIIKNIGVDLRIIDLQNEMHGIEYKKYKIKDDSSSNIAYLEKDE